ncbi:ABC transporter permease [Paenibacillus thiaminolyticus]|uniref:ABC transporter permease n=1 Tax=Paenibacillus thiaminolyticus TaxID=49283 RepID=A0AAP9DTT3_PANTH|nr:ABC transporter permease [Paenibacillus thiaminolyticus]MCY9533524.1 ABC transporter permease [Paenibacillus thiaminolyticus]MCY9604189.1 ABC transporter permease [Paenibacillus thiaminolyticus]MCY9606263.1 ABC transporter permease [Paenibacillus thiaminolyticus]MCY9612013.1 ABC transporter permease [Paenibacillus thiaminolyticus]MCY9618034.1 ABC transporter permease [Paenibacillus thiaminolyticus]
MSSLLIAQWFLKRMFANKRTIFLSFILPAVLVSAFLLQLHIVEQSRQAIMYVDHDRSELSAHLLQAVGRDFELIEAVDEAELREHILELKSSSGFVIPPQYGDDLMNGELPAPKLLQLNLSETSVVLQLLLNEQTENTLLLVNSIRSRHPEPEMLNGAIQNALKEQRLYRVHANVTDYELYVSPSLRISMGLFLMFMLLSSMNLVSVMLEDKLNYTMQRTATAPVHGWQISLGQFLGGFFFGTLQIAAVLLLTRLVGIDMGMSLLAQWSLLELFLITSMGMACMLGSIVGSPALFNRVSFGLIVPTCMLGGCYWPIEMMNSEMQKLSYFVPQRWVLDAMDMLASGGSWSAISLHVLVLLLFGFVLMGIGSAVLRPAKRHAL